MTSYVPLGHPGRLMTGSLCHGLWQKSPHNWVGSIHPLYILNNHRFFVHCLRSFPDLDLDFDDLGGNLTWVEPTDDQFVEFYAIYQALPLEDIAGERVGGGCSFGMRGAKQTWGMKQMTLNRKHGRSFSIWPNGFVFGTSPSKKCQTGRETCVPHTYIHAYSGIWIKGPRNAEVTCVNPFFLVPFGHIVYPNDQAQPRRFFPHSLLSINQSINKSINPSINQSIHPSFLPSIHPSIHQSTSSTKEALPLGLCAAVDASTASISGTIRLTLDGVTAQQLVVATWWRRRNRWGV